ncbi:MAG: type II toxin-antitoxin system VapC family toxin [bacterium]|nr:type II toxin-antitoxin system VapC family toxin [bacterium]
MNLLLDTHALLWCLGDSPALGPVAHSAMAAGGLPPHHSDPFHRVLVAQAQLEDLTLVTRDTRIGEYEVAVLRA